MIPRTLYEAEHEDFRNTVRRFYAEEVVPHNERFEAQQFVDREIWQKAGELGLLCATMPEAYGGSAVDRRYSAILIEEQAYAGESGTGFSLHSDIVAPYLNNFGTEEQKQRWLPKMATGEMIGAIAMTEPGTGSDLQAVKTTAIEDGDDYIVSGGKIFITNGYNCDLCITVVRTGETGKGAADISLLVIEADSKGFTKGKPLNKVGMHAQDTCELFFDKVRVPKANLLGSPGMGFAMLMQELAWERLQIALASVACGEQALEWTLEYTRNRKAFGRKISDFQNSRFKLAEIKAELAIARVFVDRCMELQLKNKLGVDAAATAKYWCSDLSNKILDECLQLHGGYGYMTEYPIAKAWQDARVQRIYGGTNEIMKELISRTL